MERESSLPVPELAPSERRLAVPASKSLRFLILERRVRASCEDEELAHLLEHNFGRLIAPRSGDPPQTFATRCDATPRASCSSAPDGEPLFAAETGELLYLLEKDLTIETRSSAATCTSCTRARSCDGTAVLVVGASGAGKSTLTWALCHHGFRYLSDELAPIELGDLRVHGYPHALCLEGAPPAPYALPASTVKTAFTLHVPADELPEGGERSRAGDLLPARTPPRPPSPRCDRSARPRPARACSPTR